VSRGGTLTRQPLKQLGASLDEDQRRVTKKNWGGGGGVEGGGGGGGGGGVPQANGVEFTGDKRESIGLNEKKSLNLVKEACEEN